MENNLLTLKEMKIIEDFKEAKEDGLYAFEKLDFGVDRSTSPIFFEELSKLGKLEVSSFSYSVVFGKEQN